MEQYLAKHRCDKRELAQKLRVNPSYVTLWLRGYVPSRKILDRAAASLSPTDAQDAYRASGYRNPERQAS